MRSTSDKKQGTFFHHKSLTKNWPGGRRNARTRVVQDENRSVLVWDKAIVNTKATWNQDGIREPYRVAPPVEAKPSDGGMAATTDTPSTQGPEQCDSTSPTS